MDCPLGRSRFPQSGIAGNNDYAFIQQEIEWMMAIY